MERTKHRALASLLLAFALLGAPSAGRVVTGMNPSASGQDAVKKAANEVGDKAEDTKDVTVKGAKKVGDKAEDAKDTTVKGAKVAGKQTGDKAGDVAGWFKKMWRKVF